MNIMDRFIWLFKECFCLAHGRISHVLHVVYGFIETYGYRLFWAHWYLFAGIIQEQLIYSHRLRQVIF